MPLPVDIKTIVEEMSMQNDEISAYLNRKTGDVVFLSDEDISLAQGGEEQVGFVAPWQVEVIEQARQVITSDDYVVLPDLSDISEYDIMERYCHSIADHRVRADLIRCIEGRGAFRRFKDMIRETGYADDWYQYRDQALALALGKIARAFLTANNIPYSEFPDGL